MGWEKEIASMAASPSSSAPGGGAPAPAVGGSPPAPAARPKKKRSPARPRPSSAAASAPAGRPSSVNKTSRATVGIIVTLSVLLVRAFWFFGIAAVLYAFLSWRGLIHSSESASAALPAHVAKHLDCKVLPGFENPVQLQMGTTETISVVEGTPTPAYRAPNQKYRLHFRHPGKVLRILLSNGEYEDLEGDENMKTYLGSNSFKFVVFGGSGNFSVKPGPDADW